MDLHGHGCLTRLGPDSSNLFLYLGDFFLVPSTFMVWDLSFQLGYLLGVFPEKEKETGVLAQKTKQRAENIISLLS